MVKRAYGLAFLIVSTVPVWLSGLPAFAQHDPSIVIQRAVERWLQGRYKVDGVEKTPMADVYEVRVGTELIYVDERGKYALIGGQMIDLETNRNLTQERVEALTAIDFKALPLDLAIKQVNGRGTRVLAVFEDPNCGYCKILRAELNKASDVTVYIFPYAILSDDSDVKARKAWCAKEQLQAWNALLLKGVVPSNDGGCDTPIGQVRELGRRLQVTGTPTMFFANGKRVPGAVTGARLNQLIEENWTSR